MPFTFKQMDIAGVILVEPQLFADERGCFLETFKLADFKENGITGDFIQDNYSHSRAGVLRGLHFQTHPKFQGKFVYALRGSIFDVVIDLRLGSPTFRQSAHVILNDENRHMLWVPPGLAHGFYVLSESADVIYKCTDYYHPASERGIHWNDPDLNIPWPGRNPIVSPKDALNLPLRALAETDFMRYDL